MKLPLILAAALAAAPAFAAEPKAPAPSTATEHTVKITDADVQVLAFVLTRTGERCAQDENFCRAQIGLNDLAKRLDAQIKAEKPK